MGRTLNSTCDRCGVKFYRRPSNVSKTGRYYCSQACYGKAKTIWKDCRSCGGKFNPKRREQAFCSAGCAARGRKPRGKNGVSLTRGSGRLRLLREEFEFSSCMVDGCDYGLTYDIHRLIEGRDGGRYEVGNMFAICPNHHAEVHRRIITLEKVSDCKLRAVSNP